MRPVADTTLDYQADNDQRNFQYISVLGFGCTLIGTWEFMLG